MANWETTATNSTYNTSEVMNNQMSGRQRTADFTKSGSGFWEQTGEGFSYNGTMGGAGTFTEKRSFLGLDFLAADKIRQYSVVGIDGNQISTMTSAIEEYVASVQTFLESAIVASEEQIASSIRGGDAEAAVKGYLEKVKSYVHNLVSTLNTFQDKLNDVGNAWVQAQSQIGSSVNASTNAFSEGTAYTGGSNVQYSGASR